MFAEVLGREGRKGGSVLIATIYFEQDPKKLKSIARWTEGWMSI